MMFVARKHSLVVSTTIRKRLEISNYLYSRSIHVTADMVKELRGISGNRQLWTLLLYKFHCTYYHNSDSDLDSSINL